MAQTNAQNLPYKLGINAFAHLTPSEFQEMYTSLSVQSSTTIEEIDQQSTIVEITDIDWEKKGKVSPVQSQQNCDAGYSFCTSSLLESYLLIKKS